MKNIYYLNNTGTRWIIPGDTIRLICLADNYDQTRKVKFYSSFGNHSAVNLVYKNKLIAVLPQYKDKNGNAVCFINHQEYYDNIHKFSQDQE